VARITLLSSRFKEWYSKNREKKQKANKEWKRKNKKRVKMYIKDWRKKNKKHVKEYKNSWYRSWRGKIKLEMVAAYGGKCTCCGEAEPAFLTIEHKKRDGPAHRKELCRNFGSDFYKALKKKGWPKRGLTLFCMNCNFASRYGKKCPHKSDE